MTLASIGSVEAFAFDSLVALEAFSTRVRPAESALATIGVTVLTLAAVGGIAIGIACAADPKCFGSCPTAYYDSAGTAVLEAEGFSNSIAPRLESRDVDRLRVRPGPDGRVVLEVRNEALETHFINRMPLLAVQHAPGEFALPDARGVPIAVRGLHPPLHATDRAWRDVRPLLAEHDGTFFTSDSATLWNASSADFGDWIDLVLPPIDADSAAVVFRMRNSLLATVLLYDLMLGDQGADAFGWMDRLASPEGAMSLGLWGRAELGMRVAVDTGGGLEQVGRVSESGPIAWKDVAIAVPVRRNRATTVRLSFAADAWRIDRIAAGPMRRPDVRELPVEDVLDGAGVPSAAMQRALLAADGNYVETSKGDHVKVRFLAGPDDRRTTYFLAWQGYYLEWMRRSWLTADRTPEAFVPGDDAMAEALARYRASRDAVEKLFYATRVPVR